MKTAAVKNASPLLSAIAYRFSRGPDWFDRITNRSTLKKPYVLSPEGQALYDKLTVVDLHCDALLQQRDLCLRHNHGHVDIPRLVEGNIALQVFAIPTQAPIRAGLPFVPTSTDAIPWLVAAQHWPKITWNSTFERARFAAQRLWDAAKRAPDTFRIITTVSEWEAYHAERRVHSNLTAGLLSLEGLHCLEGRLDNLERLHQYGVRMAGLVHLADNDIGGCAHGRRRGGLTAFGKKVLSRLEELNILVDLAHASSSLINEVIDHAARPVLVSHTGFRSVYENGRNLSDADAVRVAESGGVIGVGYFPWATGGRTVAAIVKTLVYALQRVGADHVALGSDFDGIVTTPFDATGVKLICDALLQKGISETDIAKIMGLNAARLLRETLPS